MTISGSGPLCILSWAFLTFCLPGSVCLTLWFLFFLPYSEATSFSATICAGGGNKPTPAWMPSKAFRYGFLIFFLTMFGNIVYQTWRVFGGATLRQSIKLFWTFRVPWGWAYTAGSALDWAAQYAFGFYSLMLTSALIGLILMVLFKPRTWCSFCPMGTMTQLICRLRHRGESPESNG